jgi:WD40 repeat protein
MTSPIGFACLEWIPGSDVVVAGDGGGSIHSFRPRAGATVDSVDWIPGVVKSISSGRGEQSVFVSGMQANGVWEFDAYPIRSLRHYTSSRNSLRRVAALASGEVIFLDFGPGLWRAPTAGAAPEHILLEHMFFDTSTSPSRNLAMTIGHSTWLIETGRAPHRVDLENQWRGGAVDDDGAIVLFSRDRLIWRPAGEMPHSTYSLPSEIGDAVFVPRRGLLAVACHDGAVRIFQQGDPAPVAEIWAHSARVSAVAASSDGDWLASAGWDGHVQISSMAALVGTVNSNAGFEP